MMFSSHIDMIMVYKYQILLNNTTNTACSFGNCTHFRHPTDEQLRRVDIFNKSLYNSVNIYVIITGPEEPVEKKMVLELRFRE